jgi:glycosyltransferase involved in cell wall biosynthesis
MNGISIVIPAYNESAGITATVEAVCKMLRDNSFVGEVIVVSDGSEDDTAYQAFKAGAVVWSHHWNMGYGAALKTGIMHSQYDTIVTLDADSTYPAEEIPKLIDCHNGYNLVSGRRMFKENMSFIRSIGNKFFAAVASTLLGRKIYDISSGMKVFNKSTYEYRLLPLPNTLDFMVAMTVKVINHGVDFVEKPIAYNPRKGKSKLNPITDGVRFLRTIILTR